MNPENDDLAVVEDLVMAVKLANANEIEIIEASVVLNLADFDLTPEELRKFKMIFKRLNSKLYESLQESCPAVSVISEIRDKSELQKKPAYSNQTSNTVY